MKSKVTLNVKLTSALLSALLVGPAAAESVLIHEEPTHWKFLFIHPEFKLNPERGTVAAQVSVNDFPGAEASYRVYTKLVKGLVYDRASNEIRHGATVCAKVR